MEMSKHPHVLSSGDGNKMGMLHPIRRHCPKMAPQTTRLIRMVPEVVNPTTICRHTYALGYIIKALVDDTDSVTASELAEALEKAG